AWTRFGVNPFSLPALISFVLCVINIVFVMRRFPETLPPERRGAKTTTRTINPLSVLETRGLPGVPATIFTYFVYLTIFSGMEFTLTFLASERFQFSPAKNGLMFLFVGLVLTLTQGSYVRRKAHQVGERRMAL